MLTAGADPLRDEGREYAERLKEAGVSVTYKHFPASSTASSHGQIAAAHPANVAAREIGAWLKALSSSPVIGAATGQDALPEFSSRRFQFLAVWLKHSQGRWPRLRLPGG